MIATIRVRDGTNSRFLCELDLMRFSEEQVRNRMEERGIKDDAFFVCGFSDWEVDVDFDLQIAYILKRCVVEVYDGDETVVADLLRKHKSVHFICSHYYQFVGKDELEVMEKLLASIGGETLLGQFFELQTWQNLFLHYQMKDMVYVTPKGFYVSVI